ncbi:patatin-like phospholipase family protein [Pseudorhodobacter sp.]|uniref:patatin-like phospholipase family protein n=1 Tax=Pseudorhodobacter sp. TaxID=1934400 RepID=UPI002649FA47|nr:patatin-like phospholipase family protein [Pseudorhodobacter sp.]MDN5788095.1 patatin-like phospholipase family protein [Pseudorhodobacter sp.]
MHRFLIFLTALLAGCAAWNAPLNTALETGTNAALVDPDSAASGEDDIYIGLAFSGGGTRASAFAYGMAEALRETGVSVKTPNGLLDNVRLVSGVSGGSVTAAQLGLYGPQGLIGYREKYLLTDAEKYMANSLFNPLTVAKGIAGGANGRDSFGRYIDEVLFKGATFGDLRKRSHIKTWINATDIANASQFLFSPETFDALCSDLSRLPIAEAVAASAAVPLVFTPIVLQVHQGKCAYKEPDWLTAARFNPEASAAMRAHARALESYSDPEKVKFVKLLDGGITDNFGTTGLAVERARAQAPYAPMTAAEAVRLKRLLFLVADAGVQHDYSWTQTAKGPGGPGLGAAVANAAISSATRSGYDAMRGEMKRWQEDLIEWRCALPAHEVRRLRGAAPGAWDCADVKLFVGMANFDGVDPAMHKALNKVPTRLRLKPEEVDLVIEAGRIATRNAPEFNGFVQSLAGNDVESRIADGIARGGRRVMPVGQ